MQPQHPPIYVVYGGPPHDPRVFSPPQYQLPPHQQQEVQHNVQHNVQKVLQHVQESSNYTESGYHQQLNQPTHYEQYQQVQQTLKRPRTSYYGDSASAFDESDLVEIKYLKEFNVPNSSKGLDDLLSYIEYDIKIIKSLVIKNTGNLTPWVRHKSLNEILQTIQNIQTDIESFRQGKYSFCSYDDSCRYKECCAMLHTKQFRSLIHIFESLQYSANKYIERNTVYHGSMMMRHLAHFENQLWNVVSRMNYGRGMACHL